MTTTAPAPADAAPSSTARPLPRLGVLFTYENGERAATRGMSQATAHGIPLILDSGAWSVFNAGSVIDPADHARFVIDSAAAYPGRYLGLDVIGDDEATWRNWNVQRDLGAPVEPTIHFGEHPDKVKRYVDAGLAVSGDGRAWVNCGGMVAYASRPAMIRKTMAWVAAVRRNLPDHVAVHGLGMVTPRALDIMPFEGVDSSYWLVSYARFRTLPLFDPAKRNWRRITLMTSKPEYERESRQSTRGVGPMLRHYYGTTLSELWQMNDQERIGLSLRSHAYFADTYRVRHRVPNVPIVYLAGAPTKADDPMFLEIVSAM